MIQPWLTARSTNNVINNIESLQSLLSVQEILSSSTGDAHSLTDALPGILRTILETTGYQNGRISLITSESNATLVVSATDGRDETESLDSPPRNLQEALEFFDAQPDREVYIAHSPPGEGALRASGPEETPVPWSEIFVPLRAENSTFGILSLQKPGSEIFAQEMILLLSLFARQMAAAFNSFKLKTAWQSAETQVQEILRDKHDLAAILVHDLQGPLANVLTSLELLEAEVGGEENSSLSLMMDIAIRSSKLLEALVNSLLDISRLEAGQQITDLELVAVSDIVDYVAEVEGPVLEQRQVTLVRDIDPNLPLIKVNVDILQRVLLNLFDNALKVSKRDQKIFVSAYHDVDNRDVRICVLDQGPGVPEAYHERIFEKYQRVDESSTSKGLGLGLAFCKLAMEAHGGRIWVENTAEQGACFCLILPIDNQITSSPQS